MRDYGKVHTSFWASETLRDLDADAKLLALYLLTSPHTNTIGAFRLPDAYACEDLGWDAKRFQNGLETLSACGFIRHDRATRWVWIVNWLKFNEPANPNMWKACRRMAEAVPALPFRSEILRSAGVSETVVQPLGNAPSPSPSPSLLFRFPLADGSEYEPPADLIDELRAAYPGVNLPSEMAKARAWCVANEAKRKTQRGMPKFLNSWLSGAKVEQPSKAALPGGGRRAL